MMIDEEWRGVANFEGFYEVSNLGRVRSVDRVCVDSHALCGVRRRLGHMIRGRVNKVGYPQVVLYRDGKGKTINVHRLVAFAFVPNPKNLPFVNHIDGVKTNFVATNLEWVDDRINKQHAINIGRITRFKKLLTSEEAAEIRVLGGTMTQTEIAKRFGCTQTNVSLILLGRIHAGIG